MCCFFFFKQKTAYEMRISDWSSDVCSSDLATHDAVVIGYIAKAQKILDRTYIRLSSEQLMSKQPFQFRSENQTAVRQHCIMKRLYPQPVAHQPERLGGGIEKGEGEHAIEPVHALRDRKSVV